MRTDKHPRDLTNAEAQALIDAFDAHAEDEYRVVGGDVLGELRAAAMFRRAAEERIEAAVLAARRAGASWGVIGTQLGVSRQGARQKFERLDAQ